MKALVLHGPGHFNVEHDWPTPQIRPGWARVQVTHAGICGSDLPRFVATGSYHHPIILGHEFAGVIETPAPGSKQYRRGERVAILPIIPCGDCPACDRHEPFHCQQYQFLGSRNDGGFAEYCLVPEQNLFRLPTEADLCCGAFLEPLAVALHVVRRSGFTAGQRALVFGAGTIGLLIGLWLKVFGAGQVVMADVRPESLDVARRAGFEKVTDPAALDSASLPAFDVTVEAAGASSALIAAIEKTKDNGTIAIVGRDTGDTVIPLPIFERMMRKEIDVRCCWGYNVNGEEDFLREMLRQGRFPLQQLITHHISLDEAPDMIQAMAERSIYYCKVIIDMERSSPKESVS